ncbi:MAG: hypothetical protein II897_02290, partial [Clostridia bacterium]|nr:hypothetical protein [Clostridia bacterium]
GRKDGRVRREKRRKGQRGKTNKGNTFGRIHLTIHSLKRDLFAPYRVKNARKTSVKTLLGFTAAREQKTEDGSPSPVSFSVSSVFTAENLRLLK